MSAAKNLWNEASTVLLLRKSKTAHLHQSQFKFNYKILMLERSSKSKFMPSAYVFPGGHVSKSDFVSGWNARLTIKSTFSASNDYGLPPVQYYHNRSPMLKNESNSIISKNVGLRLCGIRETFEEIGILLDKTVATKKEQNLNKKTLSEWRTSIHKDDSLFLKMCQELSVVPDIWSLHEWSNWLTPTHTKKLHGDRRYDTIFYISFLTENRNVVHDDKEIVAAKWYHPVDLLADYNSKKLWLAPPQVYELFRFFQPGYGDFDRIRKFAIERETQNCERYCPVRILCEDGGIGVLPGDDLYPEDLDIYGVGPALEIPSTVDASREQSRKLHRFEFKDPHDCQIVCNIELGCSQISPAKLSKM